MRKAAAWTSSAAGVLLPVLLIIACAAISASAGPVLFPFDPQVKECLDSFFHIPGCAEELFRSFITGTVGIGPACCKVINELVGEKCFPKLARIYPFNPVFVHTIKAHCQTGATPPAPAPRSSRRV